MVFRFISFFFLGCSAVLPTFGANAVASRMGDVAAVHSSRLADLVIIRQGYNSGLRQGMVCSVKRGRTEIAEVLVVGLRPDTSAAVILSVSPNQSIHLDDVIAVKILKT
ncbi:MAG: hypothetical protein RL077_4773 [Verrucomicrobiota bacterium]|jgi:hypothetical protein